MESFLNSHDGGRDGAFTGTWRTAGQEDLSGHFVIQCKFTSRANYNLTESDLSDEFDKARKLVDKGICDSYVLMTNAGLSGDLETKIDHRLKSVGVKHVRIHGSDWINQQILENKRLRTLVPRVYGLGDLSQVLYERAYEQSRSVFEFMKEDLAKVVVTNTYQKAVDAINEHGFVLLIGEAAAGKITIASLLAMAAFDQWDSLVLKLDEPRSVVEHWNPHELSGRRDVPKTIIFAKDDSHADDILRVARLVFDKGNDFCQKITYKTTGARPEDLLASFRNSYNPRIVVTVDMIATGTDIKPVKVVFFTRNVHSRSFFEQMKGGGVRTISSTEFNAVTPDARNKDRFVIVDAVGVTETELSDAYSLDRQPTVSFDKLMDLVGMGSRGRDVLSSLASRLARLDRQLTPQDRQAIEAA